MKRQYVLSVILLTAFTAHTSAQSRQDSITTTKDINEIVLVSSRSRSKSAIFREQSGSLGKKNSRLK